MSVRCRLAREEMSQFEQAVPRQAQEACVTLSKGKGMLISECRTDHMMHHVAYTRAQSRPAPPAMQQGYTFPGAHGSPQGTAKLCTYKLQIHS